MKTYRFDEKDNFNTCYLTENCAFAESMIEKCIVDHFHMNCDESHGGNVPLSRMRNLFRFKH